MGEDDDTFEAEVNAVLGPPPDNDPAPDAAGGTSGAEEAESCGSGAAESDPDDPEADGSGSEAVTNGLESDTAPEDNPLTPDAITQCAHRSDATEPSSRATGAIVTASGVIDVRLAADFTLSDDEETNEADEREENENRSLNVVSNRLGGQDLRVVRDNMEALTQSFLNENGKRSPAESAKNDNSASFAKSKRIRMQQRLDDMQKNMDDAESRRSSSTGEMMKLLMFFQKDSERRAEAEERRRRMERDEHLEAVRRERAEREQVRREEAEAAEKTRLQEVQIVRENREEQRRLDADRESRLEREREENRRQFEERLALERSEARQRHEQMLMLLSTLQKK
uniref:Pinin/SDK/MemA protein domain-containing protein n=1 Tax=Phytophthora ramorum TaxID=164328 RepID=H3GVI9_PHYRM